MKFCNYWKIYWYLIYLKGEKKNEDIYKPQLLSIAVKLIQNFCYNCNTKFTFYNFIYFTLIFYFNFGNYKKNKWIILLKKSTKFWFCQQYYIFFSK